MKSSRLLRLGLLLSATGLLTSCNSTPNAQSQPSQATVESQFGEDFSDNGQPAKRYLLQAILKQIKGNLDGAIDDYTRAIEIDPNYRDAYINRARVRNTKGDFDGSIADYTKVIELKPDYVDAYIGLAAAYFNRGTAKNVKGDYDGAIADYDKASALNPSYAKTYNRRGYAKCEKGDFDGAIADYTKTIKLDPNFFTAYNGLAWILATCPEDNIRNGQQAVEYATKACDLTQWKNTNCLDTLAAADAETGKFDDAVKWESKYLESGLAKDDADQARQRLSLYEQKKPYHEAKKPH